MGEKAKIENYTFHGLIPQLEPRLLPENASQVALDVDLRTGKLVPLRGLTSVVANPYSAWVAGTTYAINDEVWHDGVAYISLQNSNTGREPGEAGSATWWDALDPVLTIYKFRAHNDGSSEWLKFTDLVDIVNSPVNGDTYERIFYTGHTDTYLHQRGTSGGVPFDRAILNTPPSTAPTVTLTELFNTALLECEAYIQWSATDFEDIDCVLQNYALRGASLIWTFEMPKTVVGRNVWGDAIMYFRIKHSAISAGAWIDVSDLGTEYPLTDSTPAPSVVYAKLLLQAITGTTAWDEQDLSSHTYEARTCSVQFSLVQNLLPALDAYYYFQTFVNDLGQEGPISSISTLAYRSWSSRAAITGLAAPTAGQDITYRRIYRSLTGSTTDASFALVVELAHATATYYDWISTPGMSYENRVNPVTGLKGLVSHPARFLAAFIGDMVWVTQANLPHSWPYYYQVDAPIVGLAVNGNDIVVLTIGTPTVLSGVNPAALRMSKLMVEQSCVSKEGICKVGDTVLYPSPDGMVSIHGGQARLLTEGLIHPWQWAAYTPSSMVAVQYDGLVFMSMTNANLILNPSSQEHMLTTFSETFRVATNDLFDDSLFMYLNGVIYSYNSNSSAPYTLRWRNREIDFRTPKGLSRCRIIADTYPAFPNDIQLLVYVNEVLFVTMSIRSDRVYNLPFRRPDKNWSYEVRSTVPIISVEIGQSAGDFIYG